MKRWVFLLLLAACPATARAQTIAVGYRQTISVPAPGTLAAFSLDDYYAEAKAEDETLIIFGKNPGMAHVVAIFSEGTKTFDVQVLPAPTSYPPGFVPPLSGASGRASGSYESRYSSGPSQTENIIDFMGREGDRTLRFHLSGTLLFTPVPGEGRFDVSSAFYQIATPGRDITFLDQLMTNSPLTVDGSTVRGFHFRQGDFLFHAGYASLATFENFIIPTRKEGVIGAGYRFSLSERSVLIPNFYFFAGRPVLENTGQRGIVASLVYDYEREKNLSLLTEVGLSRGVGAAARFHYAAARNSFRVSVRYEPVQFASLSLNNLHGFYSDVDWTSYVTSRLTSTLSFTDDRYTLRTLNLTNLVASLNLQFKIFRGWSLLSGANYGDTKSHIPVGAAMATRGLPIGLNFYSHHFQGGVLYQYSANSSALKRSDEFRGSLGTRWSGFHLSGFVDRQTQAPTINFMLAAAPGLREALDTLAISATTPEQIALALRETAGLANQGVLQRVNINPSPVRLQAGSDLTWTSGNSSRQQFHFNLLYNRDELLPGSNQTVIASGAYTLKFKNANEFFASLSLFRSNSDGSTVWRTRPLVEISIRRRLGSAPNFIIPRRRGTIQGVVFADDGATGRYQTGGQVLVGAEVVLDDARRVRTDRSGHYAFPGVSYGPHFVELIYQSASPFFFTTASRVQADVDSEINFGVGLSLARILGIVRSDAGIGLRGVEISVVKGERHFSAQTDAEGEFRLQGLSSGDYEVKVDMDSVPPGYSLAELEPQRANVESSLPAHVAFTLKAIRNISGRVTIYDRASHKDTPVPGLAVSLREPSQGSVTDENGVYLFRDLTAGSFVVIVSYQGREFRRDVVLPDVPAFPKDIDINLGAK